MSLAIKLALKAEHVRQTRTRNAFQAYLDATRGKTGAEYEQAEARAWNRLEQSACKIPGGLWPGIVKRKR